MKDLIHLIRSLTTQEKKFFKEATKGEKLLMLFDYINKNKLADASEIRKQPFYHRVLPSKLQEAILKSLRALHEDFSLERRIDNLLHEFDILVSKKQFKLAEKKVTEGLSICEKENRSPKARLRLYEALRFVQKYSREAKDRLEGNKAYLSMVKLSVEELKQLEAYMEGLIKIKFHENKLGTPDASLPEPNIIFEKIRSFSNLNKIKPNYHKYLTELQIIQHRPDLDAMKTESSASLRYLRTTTTLSKTVRDSSSTFEKVYHLMLVMHSFTTARDYDSAYHVYRLILDTKETTPLLSFILANQFFAISIHLLLKLGKAEEAVALIEEETPRWDKHLSSAKERIWASLLAKSLAYFCSTNFRKANHYIQTLLTSRLKHYKGNLKAFQLYEVIVFCELGKLDLVERKSDLYLRKQKAEGVLTPFDRCLSNFIKGFIDGQKEKMRKEFELGCLLLKDTGPANGSILNSVFNFVGWMESKVNRTPFNY